MRPLFNSVLSDIFRISLVNGNKFWALNINSNSYGIFNRKMIDVDSDIDITWNQRGLDNSSVIPKVILSQSISTAIASREFSLRWQGSNGLLLLHVGGVAITPMNVNSQDGVWRIRLSGSNLKLWHNGVLLGEAIFNRGSAREVGANTLFAARNNGGVITERFNNFIWGLNINNIIFPISEPYSAKQNALNSPLDFMTLQGVIAEQWQQLTL